MKVKLEMELADLLRISVLLDHHRKEALDESSEAGGDGQQGTSQGRLWSAWGSEAAELNKKLLSAIELSGKAPR